VTPEGDKKGFDIYGVRGGDNDFTTVCAFLFAWILISKGGQDNF
jgi:hypothetical protein